MGGLAIRDEGGIAQSLWKKSTNEAIFAVYTPYILSLASGKLDSGSFLHCIFQDLRFLEASAEAFEMAEEFSDDDDDKAVIRKIRKRVLKKMTMFRSIVQEWGFELPAGNISDRAMIKYTDFLLAAASGESVREKFPGKFATPFEKTKLSAYALAAMAPSMRLQSFLSKEIQAVLEPDEDNHLYKKWIDSCASQKFEDSASQIEELLDKLTVCLTGEELQFVETIYHKAMKLQVDFFSAQPIIQNTVVPLYQARGNDDHNVLICSGYDMTCSAVDSGALLADVAIIKSSKTVKSNGYESGGDETSLDNLRDIWSGLHRQYVEEYEQCIDNIMLSEKVAEFDFESLCNALAQLSDIENAANLRVDNSGVLKGLHMDDDIKWAAEHLIFQDGCLEFFREIEKRENVAIDAHILSYCWSGDLIRSAFNSDSRFPNVHSNELLFSESISTGEILKKVQSPIEKLQTFNNICNNSNNNGPNISVYIGGSVEDLLCLLKADIGIVISPSANIKKLGGLFGFSFVPLFSGLVKKQIELIEDGSPCWKGLSGTLYTVSSWAEIHAFILGV
ncbi:putative thiaminase-2/PQQC, heme oxygenase-like, multi-helical, HAD superfamily [Helianthus annuus]|uniref:Thiaminase-2/PQQC, heme oxygenase-like, multi-helical, HAD superfamily n=1 Tax=Helianthus annuus TaxID=4232 RepID=A0A9K3HVF6_HELAN|nr:putative thiaminase-2/PQQC, heme oxygenase-like, multi-helical, HAD superfamily [Helianthus annuus]KAJ0528628.1 putative thiaminase-2/PQQC, heme oxygenase-like, multi-helical, HAD superfamily [Helianthus annuus]KAJ0699014.1 putative thiaminase-2/PQQC, heme oxygenase-like, multi-helical, HAD superfamily [Helianthus annuus]KAJ0877967.1 putative thiaminase-2/PQQC, heme oxygenase-like, multi-helical, HAD superfamily [Helianthus annuus]